MPTNEALSNDEFSKEQPLLFRKIQSAVDVMRQLENAYKNYDERNDNQWTIVILALGKSAIYQLERSLEVLKEHKIFNGWVAEARGVVLDCLQPLKVGPKKHPQRRLFYQTSADKISEIRDQITLALFQTSGFSKAVRPDLN